MKVLFVIGLAVVSFATFLVALKRCRQRQFMSDTYGLWLLGIFVWGDALVLAPFWLVSAIAFYWLPWVSVVRWILFFFLVREAYEVVYWLNHQAVKSDYRPPFLRQVAWLTTEQVMIIYQLLAMCQVIMAGVGLLLSYHLL